MLRNHTCCRLCGSDHYGTIRKENQNGHLYSIVKCLHCSLIYIRETYVQVSPKYKEIREEDLTSSHIWLQSKHKEEAFRQCLELLQSFSKAKASTPHSPALLDVGCGTGGWLEFVRSEYKCYGFDASPVQSRYSLQNFPNVRCATSLSEYKTQFKGLLPEFDLITLWDVLEHIRSPVDFVGELSQALSGNGLFFASIPGALPMVVKSQLLSIGWPKSRFSWSPCEHSAYYSPKTLRILCEKCNLKVLRIGAVRVYPRTISMFEGARRLAFSITRAFPHISPQIFVLAIRMNDQ